jgi:hypothetical protein
MAATALGRWARDDLSDSRERVFKASEYFWVNPDDWSLQGWHLEHRHDVALPPDARGWLWFGTVQRRPAPTAG